MTGIIPVTFVGGATGPFRVEWMRTVVGEPLVPVASVSSHAAHVPPGTPEGAAWALRGTNAQVRYVERRESDALRARQAPLGRADCTLAALIPIRKKDEWWELPQDERRAIFETRSRHIASCLEYLPAIARRLHQSRELGEPFDFLTWFEYAPEHADLFEELVGLLRATPEWEYVDREIDIRLVRSPIQQVRP